MYKKTTLTIDGIKLKYDYTIDTLGIIRNETLDRELKGGVSKCGYRKMHIVKYKLLHRLVAQHFIPNPLGLAEVNHIDGDKLNNKVSNLEWCTREYNVQHAFKLGLKTQKGSSNANTKLSEVDVITIYKLKGLDTIRNIARRFKIHYTTVSNIWTGYNWSSITGA